MGRPPKGARLVEGLEGSPQARQRLTVILETVSGARSIASACEALGLSAAAFHRLRERTLAEAMASLEPRPLGRPRKEVPAEEVRMKAMAEDLARLEMELHAARVREEILRTMPHLLDRSRPPAGPGAKKGRSPRSLGRR